MRKERKEMRKVRGTYPCLGGAGVGLGSAALPLPSRPLPLAFSRRVKVSVAMVNQHTEKTDGRKEMRKERM